MHHGSPPAPLGDPVTEPGRSPGVFNEGNLSQGSGLGVHTLHQQMLGEDGTSSGSAADGLMDRVALPLTGAVSHLNIDEWVKSLADGTGGVGKDQGESSVIHSVSLTSGIIMASASNIVSGGAGPANVNVEAGPSSSVEVQAMATDNPTPGTSTGQGTGAIPKTGGAAAQLAR